jgi:hypothetical protein
MAAVVDGLYVNQQVDPALVTHQKLALTGLLVCSPIGLVQSFEHWPLAQEKTL